MPRGRPKGSRNRNRRRNRSRSRSAMARRMTIRKPLALKPHTFVERFTSSDNLVVNTAATATGLFKSFNLDQIRQVASYKDLFEYYTIHKVVVEFRYKSIGNIATLGAVTSINPVNEVNPVLYFKVDHNDVSSDTLEVMKESCKTREHQFSSNKPNFSIQIKPAVLSEAYKSSIATTYVPKWGQQLSTADGTVPHYGLKCYAVGYADSNTTPGSIQVSYKMYFTMKNNE